MHVPPISSECVNTRALPREVRDLGYTNKNIYRFKNNMQNDFILMPDDSKLSCFFDYDFKKWDKSINNTLVLRLREHLRFQYNEDGSIEPQSIESGEMYANVIKL
jgi:hypothetical protein